jgi:hypothetical protein
MRTLNAGKSKIGSLRELADARRTGVDWGCGTAEGVFLNARRFACSCVRSSQGQACALLEFNFWGRRVGVDSIRGLGTGDGSCGC